MCLSQPGTPRSLWRASGWGVRRKHPLPATSGGLESPVWGSCGHPGTGAQGPLLTAQGALLPLTTAPRGRRTGRPSLPRASQPLRCIWTLSGQKDHCPRRCGSDLARPNVPACRGGPRLWGKGPRLVGAAWLRPQAAPPAPSPTPRAPTRGIRRAGTHAQCSGSPSAGSGCRPPGRTRSAAGPP